MFVDAEASFYNSARAWARRHAARIGIVGDRADDFEQSFVVKWLLRPVEPPVWTWPPEDQERYLNRAARNFALNTKRLLNFEAALFVLAGRATPHSPDAEDVLPPENALLRNEFWREIRAGIGGLSRSQRELLACFYLGSATVEDLALASGRSRHAVIQILSSARLRLRSTLAARGATEIELRSYMAHLRPCSAHMLYQSVL